MLKRILSAIVLIVIVAVALKQRFAHPPQKHGKLRVMTWNLEWFPGGRPNATFDEKAARMTAVRAEIKRLDPDVVLLEEVASQEVIEELLKPLSPDWKVAIVSRFEERGQISGQQIAIAAKMPAESAWAEKWERGSSSPPRGYSYATYLIDGKRLAFYALHLKANLGDEEKNAAKREEAMTQLMRHLHTPEKRLLPADAVLIGGDFNTDDPTSADAPDPHEQTFAKLRAEGFRWGYEGVSLGQRITCPGKGKYPDACFDQIWTRGLGSPAPKPYVSTASDHYPVVVDIDPATITSAAAK